MTIAPVADVDFYARVDAGEAEGALSHSVRRSPASPAQRPTLTVILAGNADLNVKADLDRFVAAVHSEAQRSRAKEVLVDLKELEFMNSSCLKSFVWWITRVQELATPYQYKITFVSSPSMYWQRRSLSALAGLASDLVSISA
jgi:hypothetical protein